MNFWTKLGLSRDKKKEAQLHNELESSFVAAETMLEAGTTKPLPRATGIPIAPYGELRDIPVVDILKWDVFSIRSAVGAHVNGQFGNAALLTDAMMADDRVQGATNGRIKGITKRKVSLKPSPKAKDQVKAKKVALEIENNFSELLPESVIEDIIKWQVYSGFALCELVWELKGWTFTPRIKVWHPLYIYYNVSERKYIAFTTDGQLEIEANDPKWALYTPYGSYRGWMRGAVRSVSIPWVVRQFALRDWARYSEVHGLPQKKAKVPAQAPVEDKRRFFNSVKRLGSETAFLLPVPMNGGGEWDIELLEARDTAWKSFDGLIDRCDKSITLTVRGTNLTTEVKTGTGAATEAHRDEDSDYADSDCRKLAEFLYKQVFMLYCLYNYGDASLAPVPSFDAEEVENNERDAKTWVEVAGAMTAYETLGWELDAKIVANKFGIPLLSVKETAPPQPAQIDPKTGKPLPPPPPGAGPPGKPVDEKKNVPPPGQLKEDSEQDLPE